MIVVRETCPLQAYFYHKRQEHHESSSKVPSSAAVEDLNLGGQKV
jgi:hypothetical protein